MSSIRRLKLCSLSRLSRMSKTLSDEIQRLKNKVSFLEKECDSKLKDELSVGLSINHGQYQTTIDELEYKIDSTVRQIEDLEEKREKIEEVRLSRHLQERQVEKLGSLFLVKLKDSILFFLILFVLSLLATEVYRIGATGKDGRIQLIVKNDAVVDVQVINGGSEYEAVEISAPSRDGESAIFQALIRDGKIKRIDILDGGSGYNENFYPRIIPSFSRSTLWVFWTIDTICCVLFFN